MPTSIDDGSATEASEVTQNSDFVCPAENCNWRTDLFSNYSRHVKMKHADAIDLGIFKCPGHSRFMRCGHCGSIQLENGLAMHFRNSPACNAQEPAPEQHPPPVGLPQGADATSVGTVFPTTQEAQTELLASFNIGLFTVYRTWRAPMYRLCKTLLTVIIASGHDGAHEASLATLAFLLLPGVVNECNGRRQISPQTFLDKMDRLNSGQDPFAVSRAIITVAMKLEAGVIRRRQQALADHEANDGAVHAEKQEARIAARVEKLCREQRLSAAMSQLDRLQEVLHSGLTEGGAPTNTSLTFEQIQQCISSLNPTRDGHDEFTVEQLETAENAEAISVSSEQISHVMSKLPVGAAAGSSGWTYSALRAVFLASDNIKDALDLLARFATAMLAGELQSHLWLCSRAVLIPKKDGGIRPLGIGETWYRFVGRVAVHAIGPRVGQMLLPMQLGCSVTGGCEIAGRLGQLVLDTHPDLMVISLDLKNAFNTIPRGLMMKGLAEFAPELMKWFRWAYGRNTPLFLSDGRLVGESQTGCRQGDPLAVLCFCAGLQFPLRDIASIVDDTRETSMGLACNVTGVYAYIDDTNIFLPYQMANQVSMGLSAIFQGYRLHLALPKCKYLGSAALNIDQPRFGLAGDGMVLMGAPTGTPEFRINKAVQATTTALEPIDALTAISPWVAWNLLRSCITARIGYLARVVEKDLCFAALQHFDKAIDKAILNIAGENIDHLPIQRQAEVAYLRTLPLALGGLGITRFYGLAGEQACLLSRQVTFEFIEKHIPELCEGARRSWPAIVLGATEEPHLLEYLPVPNRGRLPEPMVLATGESRLVESSANRAAPLEDRIRRRVSTRAATGHQRLVGQETAAAVEAAPEGPGDIYDLEAETKNARTITKGIISRRSHEMIEYYKNSGRVAQAQWLEASCFRGSGRWLAGPGGGMFYGVFGFRSPAEYRAAYRMRLLLPLAASAVAHGENVVPCPRCTHAVCHSNEPYHLLTCPGASWHNTHRHNLIRDLLHGLIRSACSEELVKVVSIEPRMQAPNTWESLYPLQTTVSGRTYGGQQAALPPAQTYAEWRAARAANDAVGHFQADIGIHVTSMKRTYIDVSVVNPSAARYHRHQGNATQPPALPDNAGGPRSGFKTSDAVLIREQEKRDKYRTLLHGSADDDSAFVPFVIEATGRLGPTATSFLRKLLEDSKIYMAKSIFVCKLGAIIARYNAMMVLAWERSALAQ